MLDPTIIVNHAGGYHDYRLRSPNKSRDVFTVEDRHDEELDNTFKIVGEFGTAKEAWEFVGRNLGWID